MSANWYAVLSDNVKHFNKKNIQSRRPSNESRHHYLGLGVAGPALKNNDESSTE
jgi:hypothetical protein